MPDRNTFEPGQQVRIITASGLRFAGPIQSIDDEGILILDLKTMKRVAFTWRAIERAEEL